ncbi:PQQ-binding-like beta-propeller repeat protein (plasmid) [Embleya sp. NBC_00888]|uniref:outer membrane protein assembly factor BamB family protein n=1 Tax=Embleya sp. NBC_00888 TaxID=2975960 RepID=UPI002F90B4EF|nr:PQQ-binding-like beta-propeller repeat protein [Embleya sp. NBC_00888]
MGTASTAVDGQPAVVDGVVYAGGSDKNVYALDAATGRKPWSCKTGSEITSIVTVDGVVFSRGYDQSIYAVDTGIRRSSSE